MGSCCPLVRLRAEFTDSDRGPEEVVGGGGRATSGQEVGQPAREAIHRHRLQPTRSSIGVGFVDYPVLRTTSRERDGGSVSALDSPHRAGLQTEFRNGPRHAETADLQHALSSQDGKMASYQEHRGHERVHRGEREDGSADPRSRQEEQPLDGEGKVQPHVNIRENEYEW